MEKSEWISYFLFTRKERKAVLFLMILIIVITLLPELLPKEKPIDLLSPEQSEKELQQLAEVMIDRKEMQPGEEGSGRKPFHNNSFEEGKIYSLFPFDPNTISEKDWKKLGISDRTILTVQRYLAKGGRFRKPRDIEKIYGIRPEQVSRLLPYVQIESVEKPENTVVSEKTKEFFLNNKKEKSIITATIDINTADTSTLISLPGIGTKLARRIIHFREKLGGFYIVNQLAETFGLPDSTFQKNRFRFTCDGSMVRKININTASATELKQHPYISWNIANAIVAYRQQYGLYHSTQQLEQIAIIDPGLLVKLLPYLSVQ